MSEKRARLTLEQLREEGVFIDLTAKQKLMIETFVASGDRVLAVQTAYHTKNAEVARTMAYEFFGTPKVIACLAAFYQDDPLDTFKAELRRAMSRKRLTIAQVNAMKLIADVSGWGSAALPNTHGHDDEPEPAQVPPAAKVASAPPAATVTPKVKFYVGQIVTQRDAAGVLHSGRVRTLGPDGLPLDVETIE